MFSTWFQSDCEFSETLDRNVEMTVVRKLHIQKSNIVDTRSIDCVWHELERALCCDKTLPGLTIGPTVNLITVIQSKIGVWLTNSRCNDSHCNRQGLPKSLAGSRFNENAFDCNRIFMVFSQKDRKNSELCWKNKAITANKLTGRYVWAFPQRKGV